MAIQKIKLDLGTVYQKEEGGIYYFRYQVNGARKAISLKTRNQKEALKEANKQIPLLKATSAEIIAAHIKHARGLITPEKNLLLSEAWAVYERSPERATPDTVSEALAYRSTFEEFVNWIDDPGKTLRDITSQIADEYAQHMRTLNIAVSTHNRKIKRIRRVFRVLREYWSGENPFQASTLLRKEREEREHDVHRLSFTREQEQQLQAVLDDDKHKVMNKPEVRVIYYLGMFTGQRMKDCVLLRWNKINFNLKRIWVKQFKTGKEVTIPIAPKLLEVLQGALAWKTGEADYVCPNIATRYNKTNALGNYPDKIKDDESIITALRYMIDRSMISISKDLKVTLRNGIFHKDAQMDAAMSTEAVTILHQTKPQSFCFAFDKFISADFLTAARRGDFAHAA